MCRCGRRHNGSGQAARSTWDLAHVIGAVVTGPGIPIGQRRWSVTSRPCGSPRSPRALGCGAMTSRGGRSPAGARWSSAAGASHRSGAVCRQARSTASTPRARLALRPVQAPGADASLWRKAPAAWDPCRASVISGRPGRSRTATRTATTLRRRSRPLCGRDLRFGWSAVAEDTRFELVRGCPQHAFQACALGL